jgi:hypothetical protein
VTFFTITQVPSDHEEADAKDEALCPTDMNTITDDDLRTIFSNLADGEQTFNAYDAQGVASRGVRGCQLGVLLVRCLQF